MKVNYYEVLGVPRSAGEAEIRDRFRKLARENHPDRYRGPEKDEAERRFQTLTEAVNILTSPERRRQHDVELQTGTGGGSADFGQIAKAYIAKGVKAYKDGDFAAAYEHFDMAAKHNANDPKAFHSMALAASKIPSMIRQAVQAAETAVTKDGFNATYMKDAGILCRRAGLEAKAERYLARAVELDPTLAEALAALEDIRKGKDAREAPQKKGGVLGSLFKKG